MSAQDSTLIGLPELKVGLAGSVELPVVINRSDRNIIGYVLRLTDDVRPIGRMILHIGRLAREAEAQDRAAQELYGIQLSDGIEAARQAAERLSKLPKLWRG